MIHSVLVDRNVLPCICWCACSAADYDNVEMLWIQARYAARNLSQEGIKYSRIADAHSSFVIALQVEAGSFTSVK